MNDETKKLIEWCIKKLDEMHERTDQIIKDIEELKRETQPWRKDNFSRWLDRQSNSTDA